MRISVVCNFLSSFLTAQQSAPITMTDCIAVLYTLMVMFLSHITPVVSLHFEQAFIYDVVYIFLGSSVCTKQGAQILERFHCLHFFFLNVDIFVFFWDGIYYIFPLLTLSPWDSNVSLYLYIRNSTSALL